MSGLLPVGLEVGTCEPRTGNAKLPRQFLAFGAQQPDKAVLGVVRSCERRTERLIERMRVRRHFDHRTDESGPTLVDTSIRLTAGFAPFGGYVRQISLPERGRQYVARDPAKLGQRSGADHFGIQLARERRDHLP